MKLLEELPPSIVAERLGVTAAGPVSRQPTPTRLLSTTDPAGVFLVDGETEQDRLGRQYDAALPFGYRTVGAPRLLKHNGEWVQPTPDDRAEWSVALERHFQSLGWCTSRRPWHEGGLDPAGFEFWWPADG